jgi:DMSO/TMAO reductase YedYZ heme-binding membrane subunit
MCGNSWGCGWTLLLVGERDGHWAWRRLGRLGYCLLLVGERHYVHMVLAGHLFVPESIGVYRGFCGEI